MILDWLHGLVKPTVKTLKAPQLLPFKRRHSDAIFLDIREESEVREEGVFPGATRTSWKPDNFEMVVRRFPKERPIVLLCQAGKRSQMAAEKMTEAGFSKVYTVEGGLTTWLSGKKKGNAVAV